jgi:hypothetical protein
MSSDSEKSKDPSFQVVDKRRFDTSGQERSSESAPQSASVHATDSAAQAPGEGPQFTVQDSPSEHNDEPFAFTHFIMSLSTNVLVQLGQMPAPSGMEIPIDREAARQTIDILAMLQKRTKGNLSAEEARFFEEVLHTLRVAYLHAKSK